jgi:hypothetical protein
MESGDERTPSIYVALRVNANRLTKFLPVAAIQVVCSVYWNPEHFSACGTVDDVIFDRSVSSTL